MPACSRSFRGTSTKAIRIGDHVRLFCKPLESFLVDDVPEHHHRGRIARPTVEPIWRWLSNTVMPSEVAAYAAAVKSALLANDAETADRLANAFQGQAAARLQAALDAIKGDKEKRQFEMQLGSARPIEDLQAVIGVLTARHDLALLGARLPHHIKALTGATLDNVKMELDASFASKPNALVYALVVVMNRMAATSPQWL